MLWWREIEIGSARSAACAVVIATLILLFLAGAWGWAKGLSSVLIGVGIIQGLISLSVSRGRGIGKAPNVYSIVCKNAILMFPGI